MTEETKQLALFFGFIFGVALLVVLLTLTLKVTNHYFPKAKKCAEVEMTNGM